MDASPAPTCPRCHDTGTTTLRAMAGGVEMDCDEQPCWSCLDERIDALTLAQCHAITGYTPSPCVSIANEAERLALQESQARAHVRNKITRGELSPARVYSLEVA
jgi:hypothetical protein